MFKALRFKTISSLMLGNEVVVLVGGVFVCLMLFGGCERDRERKKKKKKGSFDFPKSERERVQLSLAFDSNGISGSQALVGTPTLENGGINPQTAFHEGVPKSRCEISPGSPCSAPKESVRWASETKADQGDPGAESFGAAAAALDLARQSSAEGLQGGAGFFP